jgi:hypothetical protein
VLCVRTEATLTLQQLQLQLTSLCLHTIATFCGGTASLPFPLPTPPVRTTALTTSPCGASPACLLLPKHLHVHEHHDQQPQHQDV